MLTNETGLPIVVRPDVDGQFSAEPVGVPESHVIARTPEEALDQVRQKLANWPGQVHWIQAGATSAIPPAAGHAMNDPDHQAYLEEIDRYRREVEARECLPS